MKERQKGLFLILPTVIIMVIFTLTLAWMCKLGVLAWEA